MTVAIVRTAQEQMRREVQANHLAHVLSLAMFLSEGFEDRQLQDLVAHALIRAATIQQTVQDEAHG